MLADCACQAFILVRSRFQDTCHLHLRQMLIMASEKAPKTTFGNVLVIGGCGFLGHHIVRELSEIYSCNLSVLDLRTTKNRFPNVTYYDADITSPGTVRSVFEEVKPQIIIHTASPVTVTDGASNTEKRAANPMYYKVNVDGTKNLLERAAEIGTVKGFIYTSSASVIHDTQTDLINADERWPVLHAPQQKEYYSETKAIAEEIVLAANRKHGDMLTTALRPASIFGEGDVQITANMMKAYEKGQTKFQLGGNENLFDFTYVGNVAHAHILAAIALVQTHGMETEPLDHEKVDGEAFFITNGQPIYFWDFARMVWTTAGDKTEPKQIWQIEKETGLFIASAIDWLFWLGGGWTPNLTRMKVKYSCMTRYFNIDKARRRLGYKPQTDMEEAVKRTVKWFVERDAKGLEKVQDR
ncbi:MAG: hypothetical protein Q9217_003133 [Psora testacea]